MKSKGIRRLITLGLVVLLIIIFTITTENFTSVRNIFMLLKESAFTGLIAIGMCFVIVGGGVDLSAGGIVCAVAILTARLTFTGMPGVLCLLCALICGAAFGLINAILITKFDLTEFVATLASGFVYTGLALIIAFHDEEGNLISKGVKNPSFLAFGQKVGVIYPITIFWIVLTLIALFVMSKTRFGVHTYAMGSNTKSASMSGVDTKRVKALGFIICGACAGLAAGLQVAFQTAASTSLGGSSAFEAIAACVVGGIVMGGGKGDPIGAWLGSLFMCLILNGLSKFGLSSSYQYIFEGAIIILATGFDSAFQKMISKKMQGAPKAAEVKAGEADG